MARRQSLAAFGAPALDYQTTGLRAHALAESMGFGATTVVGLKGSLHKSSLLEKVLCWKTGRLTIVSGAVKESGRREATNQERLSTMKRAMFSKTAVSRSMRRTASIASRHSRSAICLAPSIP